MNKNKLISEKRQTHRYREQADSCQRGRGLGGRVKGEGIKKNTLIETDNSMVMTRGEGAGGEGKGG